MMPARSKVISRDETGISASAPTLSAVWYALSKSARDLASNERTWMPKVLPAACVSRYSGSTWSGFHSTAMRVSCGANSCTLVRDIRRHEGDAGDVAARPCEACYQVGQYGIIAHRHDDGNCAGRRSHGRRHVATEHIY